MDTATLPPTPAGGLTSQEVARRHAAGLGNALPDSSGRSVWSIIRANVFTRINAMLGFFLVLVLAMGSIINAMFGLLIIFNSAIGIIQELRAKRTLDKLSIIGQARPIVIREGQEYEVSQTDIVRGDLIVLKSGAQIVVDGRVIEAQAVEVDESLLTGESDAVDKQPGDTVLSGSFVISGHGIYEATAVGAESFAGRLTAESNKFELTDSQLMVGINKILRVITWLLIPTGLVSIYTQLFRSGQGIREAVLAMVAALVPMVPEGLVLMTTIAFAVGVVRLGKHKALVNELPAIEGLARVDVVCTDKTGTLTENRMVLREVLALPEHSEQEVWEAVARLTAADEDRNDTAVAIEEGLSARGVVAGEAAVDVMPFASSRKWSGATFAQAGTWVLGAPDVLATPGSAAALQAEEIGAQGLRVLLVAHSSVPLDQIQAIPTAPGDQNIVPVGFVVLDQKVRDDAAETIRYFDREQMRVKVISGDNANSVAAVARTVGIDAQHVIDARHLPPIPAQGQDSAEFDREIAKNSVFGRVTPDQKRAMVGALQRRGHVVAMTGDGVNDVLALKDANIGVAMGAGSPAARSVAQLVLLNNSFATLPHVVAEGRRVIGNIERVANLFLTKTVYSVMLALVTGLFGLSYPFQPVHVTVTGWFTIGIPAFILSLAPNHDRAQDGFVSRVLKLAVPSGVMIGLFVALFWVWVDPGAQAAASLKTQASTATLTVLIMMAQWVLVCVARPYKWWKIVLLVVSVSAYIVIFCVPPLASTLFLDATNMGLMAQALIVGGVGCALIEVSWWLSRGLGGVRQLWDHTPGEGIFKY